MTRRDKFHKRIKSAKNRLMLYPSMYNVEL